MQKTTKVMKVKYSMLSKFKLSVIKVEDYQVIMSKGKHNMASFKLRKRQLNSFKLVAYPFKSELKT